MAYSQAHRTPLPSDPSSSRQDRIEQAGLSLAVDQKKLNPGFEAYKLVQNDASSSRATSYALPSRPPRLADLYQPRQEGSAKRDGSLTFTGLGYKQTKERALHQVIVPSAGRSSVDEPFAAYVDANGFIIALTYDARTDKVGGHPAHRLAQEELEESLPSLASISPTQWLACSGKTLVLIELQKVKLADGTPVRWTNGTELRWNVPSEGTIKACKKVDGKIRVLLQRVVASKAERGKVDMQGLGFQGDGRPQAEAPQRQQSETNSVVFAVQLLELPLPQEDDAEPPISDARLIWTAKGEEPVIMARLKGDETLLGAEAPFSGAQNPPSPAQVGAERPQEASNSTTNAAASTIKAPRGRRRAPHFSWAQTGDTVTIVFALPSWITKAHVRAHFSLGALSLSFTQEALDLIGTSNASAKITEIGGDAHEAEDDDQTHAARTIASGRYVSRSTWAEIDPTGSLWTLERAKGVSLLTLHLEKKHEGTRWMQVFADRTGTRSNGRSRNQPQSKAQLSFRQARSAFQDAATGISRNARQEDGSDDDDEAEDNEDDVPETMDPSELISMLQGMEKYTVDEDAQHGNGFGLDRTGLSPTNQGGGSNLSLDQPSLLKDGLEEEDANVGRPFVLSSVSGRDNITINSSAGGETTLLATALPSDSEEPNLLVIKHDLDGAIFSHASSSWKHTASMPALAFVLASKRDAQRVHVHKRTQEDQYVMLAFESAPQVTGSGSILKSGAGNLFLYYTSPSPGAKNAASRVVRLGADDGEEEGASGALLGVCSARLPRPGCEEEELEDTLVCLCENRVLLLRGVL